MPSPNILGSDRVFCRREPLTVRRVCVYRRGANPNLTVKKTARTRRQTHASVTERCRKFRTVARVIRRRSRVVTTERRTVFTVNAVRVITSYVDGDSGPDIGRRARTRHVGITSAKSNGGRAFCNLRNGIRGLAAKLVTRICRRRRVKPGAKTR